MRHLERRHRAERALAGYANGPGATHRALVDALARATHARLVVLVEGISDLIALEGLAERQMRTLQDEGTVVVPVGGANAFQAYFGHFRQRGIAVRCLVDAAEADLARRAIGGIADFATPGVGAVSVFVCVEDLEDELIRALGPCRVQSILEREGDLGSFRSLQRQPAWRDGEPTAQLRRFLGAGARRKLRYARLLALDLDPGNAPEPLQRVLER